MMNSEILWEAPDNWCWTTISEIGDVVAGGTPSSKEPKYWGEDINWISPSDLTGYSKKTIRKGKKSITNEGLKNSSAKVMPSGSIHFSSRAPIGYVVISAESLATNQGFKSLVPAPGIFNEYVYYYLKASKQIAEKRASGTTFLELSGNAFGRLPLPIPPLNEQKRIVAKIEELFSELDNGIAALKTAREQLKVYRQAILKHAFEGKLTAKWREANADKLETPEQLLSRIQKERDARYQQQLNDWKTAIKEWEAKSKEGKKPVKPRQHQYDIKFSSNEIATFPELPANWVWVPLNELISGLPRAMQSGPFGSNLKHSEFTASGKLVIGIDNVKDGYFSIGSENRISEEKFAELKKYEARPGDLLITVMASLGRTCVIPRDIEQAIITKHVYRISMEQHLLHPEFYNYLLQSHTISRLSMFESAQGQTRLGLNSTILKELPVPLCDITEQKKIVEYIEKNLSSLSRFECEIDSALKRSETLRQSILKKAFSGQLVPQDLTDEPAKELLTRIKLKNERQKLPNKKQQPNVAVNSY